MFILRFRIILFYEKPMLTNNKSIFTMYWLMVLVFLSSALFGACSNSVERDKKIENRNYLEMKSAEEGKKPVATCLSEADCDGDGILNKGDLCPRFKDPSWALVHLKATIDKAGSCVLYTGDSGYPVSWKFHGNDLGVNGCHALPSISEKEMVEHIEGTVIPHIIIITFGLVDSSDSTVLHSWNELVLDHDNITNKKIAALGCLASHVNSSSVFERTICGSMQPDEDRDGYGDACDAYPSDPHRWKKWTFEELN